MHVYVYVCVYVFVNVNYIYMLINIYKKTYIYIHTYIYTYIHALYVNVMLHKVSGLRYWGPGFRLEGVLYTIQCNMLMGYKP